MLPSCVERFFRSGPLAEPFFRPDPHDGAAVARSGGQGRPQILAGRPEVVLDGREHGGRLCASGSTASA